MTRAIGLLLGLGLVLAVVLAGRIPGGAASPGAAVSIAMSPSGQLQLSPSGIILSAPDMHPGDAPALGEVEMRNQTGRPLLVRLRAPAAVSDLDQVLWIDAAVDGEPLLAGPVGTLRRLRPDGFVVEPGERRRLTLRAWIPAAVRDGYARRAEDIVLEAHGEPRAR